MFMIDFKQIKALLETRCSAYRKKRNEEMLETGENRTIGLNVNTT